MLTLTQDSLLDLSNTFRSSGSSSGIQRKIINAAYGQISATKRLVSCRKEITNPHQTSYSLKAKEKTEEILARERNKIMEGT